MIGENMPRELRNSHGAWAIHLCKSKEITDSKVAKSVVTLAISLSFPPNDINISQDIATELLKVMGSETHEPVTASEVYPLLNHSTSNVMSSCMLHLMETFIVDLDWAIKKLKTSSSLIYKSAHFNLNGEHAPGPAFEENLYSRAEAVAKVLASFALMSLKGMYAVSINNISVVCYLKLMRFVYADPQTETSFQKQHVNCV